MAGKNGLMIFGAAAVTIVALFYTISTIGIPGVSATLGTNLASILPGLLVTILGMLTFGETTGSPGAMGSAAVTGLGLGVLLSEMYVVGMITDAMLAPATLIQFQGIVFVASMLFGVAFMGDR